MIRALHLQGAKSFLPATRNHLDFKPLTIIAGANSSGKSTVLQLVLLLKQAFETARLATAGVLLNGDRVSLGTYLDWSSNHLSGPIRVGVQLVSPPRADPPTQHSLLPGVGYRPAEGRAFPLTGWWVPAGSARHYSNVVAVSGDLDLMLEADPEAPTSAQLKQFSWKAKATLPGGKESSYYIRMTRDAGYADYFFRDKDTSTVDVSGFVYRLTVATPGSPDPEENSSDTSPRLCKVEGLSPVQEVLKAELSPGHQLIVQALVRTIRNVTGRPPEPQSTGTIAAAERAIQEALGVLQRADPIEAALMATLARQASDHISRLSSEQLLYWMHRTAFAVATTLVPNTPSETAVPQELTELRRLVATRVVDMVQGTLAALRALGGIQPPLLPLAERPASLDALEEKFGGEPFWGIFRALFEPSAPATISLEIGPLLQRAAEQMRLGRYAVDVRPVSRGVAFRRAGGDTDVPTESDVQRFFRDYVFHLGPLRDEPRNLYSTALPARRWDVGARGERSVLCLRVFGQDKILCPVHEGAAIESREMSLAEGVAYWGQRLGLFVRVQVSAQTKFGTVCEVATDATNASVLADLTNVGVGVSQGLPVLVLCLAAPMGATILIEQPELHLHPAVQTRLGTFLAACAVVGKQVVVETHSEHLLNGVRIMAARGEIAPAQLTSLLYLERDEFGTQAQSITIQPDGSLDHWPRGFFDESEAALRALITSERKRD